MFKGFKYRIYPNKAQAVLIDKTFGCCRFVYNQTLAYRKEKYETEQITLSKFDCFDYVSRQLKKEHEWLREVDSLSLRSAVCDMDTAYQNFFKKRSEFPKFKSKRDNHRFYRTSMVNNNIKVDFKSGKIKLPKLKWVKAKLHRSFTGQILSATISQEPSGKYYVSLLVETEHKELPHVQHNVGIHLGIEYLCVTSDGERYDNPKVLKCYEDKIAKLQRQLAHKERGSNNYEKQRKRLARCHEKVKNIRKDYLHKISHEIVSENQVIVTRDTKVKSMTKDFPHMAKLLVDVTWNEMLRQLGYKASWNGRNYIMLDNTVAIVQLCSSCGNQNPEVKNLAVRKWRCPVCGSDHDRGTNAAKNILAEGVRQIA